MAFLALLPVGHLGEKQQNHITPLADYAHYRLEAPLNLIPIDSGNKITLIIKDAFLKRGFTLAVGLVRVVPAVVRTVADPRRMDAQRRGVAADEILLFCPQLVKVRTVCAV